MSTVETLLAATATLFLALGDKTRLRLLNLIRDREICVSSFTGVLGHSQPKISRHLAYLRNAGVVEVRRDGKWMHYSISSQLDDNSRRLLVELFKWMEQQPGLQVDREKYNQAFGEPSIDLKPRLTPSRTSTRRAETSSGKPKPKRSVYQHDEQFQPEPEVDDYSVVRHNELEDFLL